MSSTPPGGIAAGTGAAAAVGSDQARGGLVGAPTGPELAARLAVLDPHAVDDQALLDLLGAQWRQLAYQQAQFWAVAAELAVRDPGPGLPGAPCWTREQVVASAAEELRAELLLTRRAAHSELDQASAVAALPRVLGALAAGVIDRRRALVFAEAASELTGEQTTVLLDRLLPEAGRLTATRLQEKVQKLAIVLDPDWAEHRYRQAVREQRVIGYLRPDGSAVITGQNLPAEQAALACARVDALAAAARRAGAAAPIDRLRATLFLGLLDGRYHGLTEAAITEQLRHQYPKPPDPASEPDAADPTAADPAGEPAAAEPAAAAFRPAEQDADQARYEARDEDVDRGSDENSDQDSAGPEADSARQDPAGPDPAGSDAVAPDPVGSGSAGSGSRWGVHLRVGVATLLGLAELPGEIAGWGIVPAGVARRLACAQQRGEWRFAILDEAGRVLCDGLTRHHPHPTGAGGRDGGAAPQPVPGGIVELHLPAEQLSALLADPTLRSRGAGWVALLAELAAQYTTQPPLEQDPAARFAGRRLRRRTQTRFARCLFPGCRRPATNCDLDHRHPHRRGGPTEPDNLAPACRHDHLLKTRRGWRLTRHSDTSYLWISPLGRRHPVSVEPLAPPLPAPIPNSYPRLFAPPEPDHPNPPPTFQPLDPHGRPITTTAGAPAPPADTDPDPPPF